MPVKKILLLFLYYTVGYSIIVTSVDYIVGRGQGQSSWIWYVSGSVIWTLYLLNYYFPRNKDKDEE